MSDDGKKGKLNMTDVGDFDLSQLMKGVAPVSGPTPQAVPSAERVKRAGVGLIDTVFVKPSTGPTMVKDTFSFLTTDRVVIEEQVRRAMLQGRKLSKSAVIRAGLYLLAGLDEAAFLAATVGVEEPSRRKT